MSQNEKYDIQTFLLKAGFNEGEILDVIYELGSCRSIPGTTLRKYLNRILDTIEDDHRNAFLKGILVGTAIHEHVENYDLEEHINIEVAKRLNEILAALDMRNSKTEYRS
ncbi:MAG: hypothetical protein ACXQT4_00155 [Methanotrichaceae archaeon]